jgi:hypothetical protein
MKLENTVNSPAMPEKKKKERNRLVKHYSLLHFSFLFTFFSIFNFMN